MRRLSWRTASTPRSPKSVEGERAFLLRVVQPFLNGFMDGSVSTLAPIFAVAFATHHAFTAFLVGAAAATGAGISMALAEALSDDGTLTGRGSPLQRGLVIGGATFVGGVGHSLPFLLPDFHMAMVAAVLVVIVELLVIAAIRSRYLLVRWRVSLVQVLGGGALVLVAAWLFGNA